MIRATTTRKILYDWHGGQWSSFYAAASSGLVEDKEKLLNDCREITDDETREKLTDWINQQIKKGRYWTKASIINPDQVYLMLPWAEFYNATK